MYINNIEQLSRRVKAALSEINEIIHIDQQPHERN